MNYEKTFQLEIRTDEDAKKLDEMKAAGWEVVDRGVFYDADRREPPRAFYLLGFNAQSEI